ncbi:L-fucose:H+ symporter permease [Capnocytophaga cynodegmi]|uniref:L-fucose:H+ symporter permease n=1 Tax=Capnocytophaga cynodegmi TaxID=28189 RepID=A0A250E6F5_9FLAO|nr:L-fucose:H+ symporter permease [Capnocytophaga cynodegmi]ATA68564.1 L-fucose:H+ symporter permease [Capnocytophaga cynodegmi]
MKPKIVEKKYIIPFVLITSLFALWGFANDITNPMVAAFQTVMEIPVSKAALVQFAFYGGYGTMAIPAAIFAQKYNYKKGILLGLLLYSVGALLFYPAAQRQEFSFFLISLYILTFGLAFLETTANPFILSMGSEVTATRRLNLAQAFNPMGSLLGMFVASNFVLSNLESDKRDGAGNLIFQTLPEAEKISIRTHDLGIVSQPYILLGFFVLLMLIVISLVKMPETQQKTTEKIDFLGSLKRLSVNKIYREGVIAQVFYVAAQIMCWTFIIQYAENIGLDKATAQRYNILAMAIFLSSRFVSTFLMKYVKASLMLTIFAIGGFVSILGVIFIEGMLGLYCLILTSGFMSLMFPTIYGLALENTGKDTGLGAAGLVMAIVGGALMPPLQGSIIDLQKVGNLAAVNVSFVLPLLCFLIIGIYGFRVHNSKKLGS